MPNWVKNEIKFDGKKERLEELLKFVEAGESSFDFNKIIPMPENIYRGDLSPEERTLYGSNNWYDWRIEHWGTKWNARDALWVGNNYVSFMTAWSTPEGIFNKLAELFPDIKFTVWFADEDLGNNCGIITYDGENITVDLKDDFEFACDVWDYDPEEMREEYE